MKILFICGSLDAGRNGVGDYTRRLASELSNCQISSVLIGIFDQVKHFEITENVDFESSIKEYRIPKAKKEKDRFSIIHEIVRQESPDWISIQYVPYAFHEKGFPFSFGKNLKMVIGNIPSHFMFHELWVGMDKRSSFKIKIFGWIQKRIILSMLRTVKPQKIHTHSTLYLSYIESLGFRVEKLPLFGNIEKIHGETKMNTKYNVIVFGGIHSGAPVSVFLKDISGYCDGINCDFEILFVGNNGIYLEEWVKGCEELKVNYRVLGEQDQQKISLLFQSSDLGISTTPFLLIEKSGSVAAMLEHGLKVLCVSREWDVRGGVDIFLPNVYDFGHKNLSEILNHDYMGYDNSVQTISKVFSDTLKNG